ncbi:MAG: cyclohexanecarboxylate-CoA ligase [Moraxellaceae bacterium]|nr:MAG: cyclohexanecarboxylate-CoA ligase [Moraxellaceae bacterium]
MYQQGFWSDKTTLDFFDQAVKEAPDRIAIVDSNVETRSSTRLSYQEFSDKVDNIALGMINLGINKHDVVSFQLPNWWQFAATHIACLKIGAISNPLMPIFRERELTFMLGFVESKLLIIPKQFRGHDHVAMLDAIRPELPALENIIVIGGEDPISFEKVMLEHNLHNTLDKESLFQHRKFSADEVCQIIYTSGTTGMPKGVMHTSNTLLSSAHSFLKNLELDQKDIFFMGSPLAHQTGFLYGLLAPIVLQTTVVLLDVWSAKAAWPIINKEKVNFTMASTPFLADLVASPLAQKCNSSNFKIFVCGGAPVPRALVKSAQSQLQLNVATVWGMSEHGAVTSTHLDDVEDKIFNTDGEALPGMEVRIVDNNHQPSAAGEKGELQARGAFTFVGYLKKPEAYTVDPEGWFDTGDLAEMDDDGYIRITGRSKDIIIRGGENIPVVEIENLLYKHDAIQDVAVVAMPDERLGELGCCFITLNPGFELSFTEMLEYLSENKMTKNYWPERLEVLAEMPRTPSGKIQKFHLRDSAQTLTRA